MPLITIFTPTYNRGYIITKLYESLIKQTCKDFEWLVIDDGSSDNTKELFDRIIKEHKDNFVINYVQKENGGKPRAINDGLKIAKGKYFFMVDSDDYLLEDAVEKIKNWILEIDQEDTFVAVGAARGYSSTEYIKGVPPKVNDYGYVDATNLERKYYNLDADMCEAYKIDIFKNYSFEVWPGEKFSPEEIVLNEMALDGYKIRWYKDIIYICEYLEDGLTKGSFNLERQNPMGYAMLYNSKLKYQKKIYDRIYNATQMTVFSIIGNNVNYILKSNDKLFTFFTLPIAIILYFRRRGQYKYD